MALANITACQKCHGSNYAGGGSHMACNSCHMENETKVHRISWYPDVRFNHSAYAKANGTTACSNVSCHGPSLTGVTQSGPSCSTCHVWPLNLSNCATCHGTPPSGTAFPNIAGTHTAHISLNPNIVCATCHQGAGSGTTDHINGAADVILDAAFNAKSGAAAYNATSLACSNISCHGGQTTPNWRTGTIDVNTQCASCHASGTTQYNSYNSGEHSRHVSRFACPVCHDTTKLAVNHFTKLDTAAMEGPASATIVNAVNYNGTSCNPSAGGLTGCHGSHNW
jgi:predicted CxxxxCH...CXXCH cytochrome family protein